MTRADALALGTWTTLYDSAGLASSLVRSDSGDGRVASFLTENMRIYLQGDEGAFAGAIALSGTLSASIPEHLPLLGFVLHVHCDVTISGGGQALVTCSIGQGTHSVAWPQSYPAGTPSDEPSTIRKEDSDENPDEGSGEDVLFEKDFELDCFTRDYPADTGQPPYPPPPPPEFIKRVDAHASQRVVRRLHTSPSLRLPRPNSCRRPAALANEASGRRSRASPSG